MGDIINTIDNDWVMEFSLDYLKMIEKLHELLNEVIKHIGKDKKSMKVQLFEDKYSL